MEVVFSTSLHPKGDTGLSYILNELCFSGGRRQDLSGRAIHRSTSGRGRDLSNGGPGRPSACKHGLGCAE